MSSFKAEIIPSATGVSLLHSSTDSSPLDLPVFVIDTYTRRLLARYGLAQGDESYEALRRGFERALPADVDLFKQYHALIVAHAKQACRKRPACAACCLQRHCPQRIV